MLLAVLLAAAPVVRVDLAPSCSALNLGEIRRVVALELRLSGERDTAFATKVHATCDGTVVQLDVADPLSRKSSQRSVELNAVAEVARARTLALAIVELITASWSELALNPEPRVEPQGEPASASERAAAQDRLPRRPEVRVLLEASGQGLIGSPLRLWGGGVRIAVEPTHVFGLELDLRVDHGAAQLALGSVMADRAAAGLAFTTRARFNALGLKALAGIRGGGVRLTGDPGPGARSSSGGGPWFGAHLGGAATLELGPMCAELGVEVGAPLVGVVGTVDGAPAVPFNNFWLGARVAIGVHL